jgi:4-alpha-glucanotransferase
MFTIPTTQLPSTESISAYKSKTTASLNPAYIDPNTLEKTIPSGHHAKIIMPKHYLPNKNS